MGAVDRGEVGRFRWEEMPPEEALPGISRQVDHGTRQTLVRYVYAPGSVFPRHVHPQEQITLVVRGRLRFDVGGERFERAEGDVAVNPGGAPHRAEVLGDEEVETFNALAPGRDTGPLPPTLGDPEGSAGGRPC